MSKVYQVLVSKPKECKRTFNAEVLDDVEGHIVYGVGNTASESIKDMLVMVKEINASRAKDGKEPIAPQFEYKFDIAGLFSYYDYLNISAVARRMGISPQLMRRYACGETLPSEKRLREIETCLKEMATELASIKLMVDRKTA